MFFLTFSLKPVYSISHRVPYVSVIKRRARSLFFVLVILAVHQLHNPTDLNTASYCLFSSWTVIGYFYFVYFIYYFLLVSVFIFIATMRVLVSSSAGLLSFCCVHSITTAHLRKGIIQLLTGCDLNFRWKLPRTLLSLSLALIKRIFNKYFDDKIRMISNEIIKISRVRML